MKIAIVGNGKMGTEVARAAASRGITVAAVFDVDTNRGAAGLTPAALAAADVCVEFTAPGAAVGNIEAVARAGKPIVVGTTGWYDRLDDVRAVVAAAGTGLVYAPNFSLGVNIFARVLETAARLLDKHEMYDVAIRETHHRGKADAPSGTALHLGQVVLRNMTRKTSLLPGNPAAPVAPGQVHIASQRVGQAVGEHAVVFDSEADSIELVHRSKNRSGFALGALVAAAWIRGRKGVYTMDDVLSTD